jgi:serine/threonine protein kinase
LPLANTSTKALPGNTPTAIAEKATVPPDRTPWFAKLKATDTLHDAKATVSYIVARDGDNGERPTLALEPESLKKVYNDFSPGTVLQDRYRLIHELGRGGMGVVFLGRDQRLDRQVALKVILTSGQPSDTSATMDSRARSSFAEEARLGASLTHPAIATVFDYGFHNDNPFTVFEYIEGEMLRALVERRGRLPLDEVRLIVGPLAQALDFAHGRRIVHRDLKPENIRATEQRQFKILDLGLAREFNRQEDWRFAGTPAYAAPEQAAELPSDGRADQYALAVIVFELLTGRRPFESNSWIDLLEKHYSEAPPKPRTLVPDLPQSVEDAILRSLEKDPNRRFSTCSELAVALGCQFLAGPAPLPEILLETEIKKMGGRWKTYRYPFSLRRPRIHLALSPDALWGMHRTELMRWPLSELSDLQTSGRRRLFFRIHGVKGKDRQWFKFKNRKELRVWQEVLAFRIAPEVGAVATDLEPPEQVEPAHVLPGEPSDTGRADPRIEPVVLLRARPGTRFQLLGMVEAKAPNRNGASAGLAIRGAMMGADAVVDFHQEKLPGFTKTEHRSSGMAVRAVDDEGRLQLKTRWFSNQVGKIAIIMLAVATLELLGDFLALLTPEMPQRLMFALNFAGGLSIAGLSAALVFARWPQLVRPTALCFLSKVLGTILTMVATLLSSAVVGSAVLGIMPDAREDVSASTAVALTVGGAALLGLSMLVSASFLVFFLYLGRRAWRIDQEYRSLAGAMHGIDTTSPGRKWLGRIAWGAAIFYVAVLIGGAVYNLYASASAALNMSNSFAVIKSSTGFAISGDPNEWNTLAWKLATDSDINQRDPAEALRLAEKAVATAPKNANYLTTLGVARYRTGDFPGAIEAFARSHDGRKPTGRDAFFLAMAEARLGRDREAQGWYATANQWMRQNDPRDAVLRRIREEAFAVLDVANDRPRTPTQPSSKDAPVSNRIPTGTN